MVPLSSQSGWMILFSHCWYYNLQIVIKAFESLQVLHKNAKFHILLQP